MSASRVRQGGVFVEIGADARKFFATLDKINKQVGKVGASIAGVGGRVAGIGAAMAAPFVAAAAAGSRFQDVMLNVQASTGATTAQLDQIRKAAMAMSQSLGVGPTEAAAGFLELLKAGMSVEQVLGGAGKAAIAFAKVGGMAVADAAVVMADAMNVFKVSGDTAANTLSAAADASSTSIEGIAQAFSQVSAVAGLANQSIQDTAASLAVLANAGIKGSDAGTSLKTMLMRLMAPAEDAVGAMDQLGLSVSSFRNADGTMKPMVEIIRTLSTAMEGMDQAAKDDIFRRIFGQDAIRAAAVMTSAGVEGFNAMRDGMAGAMSVGDKFATMSSGLSGAMATLMAAMERLAIAISDAIGPALMAMAAPIAAIINGVSLMVTRNEALVASIAKGVTVFGAVGVSLIAVGSALQLVSFGMGGLIGAASAVITPIIAVVTTMASLIASFVSAAAGVAAYSAVSIAAAMGSFAAWSIANGPLLIMAAVLAAAVAYVFDLLGGFEGISSAISGGFNSAVGNATTLLTDLGSIASTTFSGIYEAIVGGDLQGAMDIAMAGLYAAWARGSEAIMGSVDSWAAFVQNTVTYMWAGIKGIFGDSINWVLNAFDDMVAAVQKSWNYVQSFIRKGFDLEKENRKVTDANAARKREREAVRGSGKEMAEADRIAGERLAANEERAAGRRAGTVAAESNLAQTASGARNRRVQGEQFAELLKSIEGASTIGQLQDLYGEFDALSQNGRLTSQQAATIEAALEDAQERISKAGSAAAGGAAAAGGSAANPDDIQKAAGDAAQNQGESVGSFSAFAASGMGVGGSIPQKQLEALQKIEQNTRDADSGVVKE
jgi:TP901 family phage tail tape measure protein